MPEKRFVHLRRKEKQRDGVPPEVMQYAMMTVSSVFKDGRPLRPLSSDEEKKLLPLFRDLDPDDPKEFSKDVKKFWEDFRVKVPYNGKELDITVNKDGIPDEPEQYVIWRFCQIHPEVADGELEMRRNANKQFYIHDPNKEIANKNKQVKSKIDANKECIKLLSGQKKDMEKARRVLALIQNSYNVYNLSEQEIENQLYEVAQEKPEQFLKIVKDTDLDIRAELQQLVSLGVINKVGNSYIYIDNTIGYTEDEAIQFMKDTERNSQVITELKHKLKEAQKSKSETEPA